jgi:hypothetical protein
MDGGPNTSSTDPVPDTGSISARASSTTARRPRNSAMPNLSPLRPRAADTFAHARARAIDDLRRFADRVAAFRATHEPADAPPAERHEPAPWVLYAR